MSPACYDSLDTLDRSQLWLAMDRLSAEEQARDSRIALYPNLTNEAREKVDRLIDEQMDPVKYEKSKFVTPEQLQRRLAGMK